LALLVNDVSSLAVTQVTVASDMSEISVTWATRGDSLDEQIAALLPTFATQLRFVNELNND